jgi:hypothetical protein
MIAAYAHLGPYAGRVVEAIDGRLAALSETPATADLHQDGTLRRQAH